MSACSCSISVSSGSSGASKVTSPSRLGGEAPQGTCLRLGAASAPRGGDPEHSPGGEPPHTRPPMEHREPPELLEPPEVVLIRRPMWAHVVAAALCGGDPTVNITALELAAAPIGGARATPQAPAGAVSIGRSVFKLSVLP